MNQPFPSPETPLRLGTRGSPLALAQAHETRDKLMAAHNLPEEAFSIEVITTTADRVQDRALSEIGGKGLFTKEIEEALQMERIDVAVHSMKDVPTLRQKGLVLAAYLPREDVRDAFVSPGYRSISDLPPAAIVGTSSLRRKAQLLARRPDLQVVEFRGNVQTRLQKLQDGVAVASFLAMAGLKRLGLDATIPATPIEPDEMLPAIAQGAIGLECREADTRAMELLEPISDPDTATRLAAERLFLELLDGSCQTPIAGLATLDNGRLDFTGEIIRPDGSEVLRHQVSGTPGDAASLGEAAAMALKAQAGNGFFSIL